MRPLTALTLAPRTLPRSYTPAGPCVVNCARCNSQYTYRRSAIRTRWTWQWIPVSGGIAFLAVLQLFRTLRRENRQANSKRSEPETWQLMLFRLLPARVLSRTWGAINNKELPGWLRRPLLGLYVWAFGCDMTEAQVEDLAVYPNLIELFTRRLKPEARNISRHHQLVCPSDGKVLHLGRVGKDGLLEQVKGVTYELHKFLGPVDSAVTPPDDNTDQSKETDLFHVIIYLAPGDYHHFHSPADWKVAKRRHFPGELLTVAPWAARVMPGLFSLNERAVLFGHWRHGFFSMTAVGAFNVGSIQLALDQDLETNKKGRYRMGQYRDRELWADVRKGDRIGGFSLGSSIVLIFEAPKNFQFSVKPGQKIYYGQPLGTILNGD